MKIKTFVLFSLNINFGHLLPRPQRHPNAPRNPTGILNADGSVDISFDPDSNAKAHLIHYGDANTTDPHDAKYMGYTETNSFHLEAKDVPTHVAGDKLPFYVQAFDRVGVGATDIDKAAYLNNNAHITGSAWSAEVTITAK